MKCFVVLQDEMFCLNRRILSYSDIRMYPFSRSAQFSILPSISQKRTYRFRVLHLFSFYSTRMCVVQQGIFRTEVKYHKWESIINEIGCYAQWKSTVGRRNYAFGDTTTKFIHFVCIPIISKRSIRDSLHTQYGITCTHHCFFSLYS